MKSSRESGFTILEVLTGITLVAAGFLGVAGLQVANQQSQVDTAQEAVATNAFRTITEQIRASSFQDVAITYQGLAFDVPDLSGDGVVAVLLDETRTDAVATQLGLPRDLDGDGAASNLDVSADYNLLPVHVQITWTNRRGETQVRNHYFLLAPEE